VVHGVDILSMSLHLFDLACELMGCCVHSSFADWQE
jgi:hypothetical protein